MERHSIRRFQRELQICTLVARGPPPDTRRCNTMCSTSPAALADRCPQPVEAEVREAVGIDELANLLDRVRRGNQLRSARRVHTVEAGRHGRRTTDAQVHFARTRRLDHLDDLPARRPPDDRVVERDDALALQDAANRVQLDPDAEVADRLLRLDERPADVVVADEAHLHGQFGLLRITRSPRTRPSREWERRRRLSAGASRARIRPSSVRTSLTLRPKT